MAWSDCAALAAFGDVTTLAGSGAAGSADGTGAAASFKSPEGVTVDAAGNVFVADSGNNTIRRITLAGVVTTFAGSGAGGSADAQGAAASFRVPVGMATDATGTMFVADYFNNTVRRISSTGAVTTLAGSGLPGSTDATGIAASFDRPAGVAVDGSGTVYVADSNNNKIRTINTAGVVATLAGSGATGFVNATGTAAAFNRPSALTLDSAGNVFVCDFFNHVIRKITPAGVVSTFAGSGANATTDGTGLAAAFVNPSGITTAPSGTMYVADRNGYVIRQITSAGVVTSLAGGSGGTTTDGNGASASFNAPQAIAADAFGHLYVTEDNGNVVRRIDIGAPGAPATTTTTIAATTTTTIAATTTTTIAATTTTTGAPAPAAVGTATPPPVIVAPAPTAVPPSATPTAATPAATTTTQAVGGTKPATTTITRSTTTPVAVAPSAIAAPAMAVTGPVAYAG